MISSQQCLLLVLALLASPTILLAKPSLGRSLLGTQTPPAASSLPQLCSLELTLKVASAQFNTSQASNFAAVATTFYLPPTVPPFVAILPVFNLHQLLFNTTVPGASLNYSQAAPGAFISQIQSVFQDAFKFSYICNTYGMATSTDTSTADVLSLSSSCFTTINMYAPCVKPGGMPPSAQAPWAITPSPPKAPASPEQPPQPEPPGAPDLAPDTPSPAPGPSTPVVPLSTPPNGLTSYYELIPQQSMVVAVHLAAVPGTDKFLYMERPSGYHPDHSREIAGTLDLVTRQWTHVETPDGLFCCGHVQTYDGKVAVVGGHQANAGFPSGLKSIRIYNDAEAVLEKQTTMLYSRWYPTATLLPNREIMIMGGTQGVGAGTPNNPYYEIWNQTMPLVTRRLKVDPAYLSHVRQNYYPFNYIMPTGDMFNFCGRYGTILEPITGTYRNVNFPKRLGYATSEYPYTATSVMLGLYPDADYKFEVVVFGGAPEAANTDITMSAGSESHRIEVFMPPADNPDGYTFSNGNWTAEDMGSPRVMGDATLLPNGYIVLLNGAMEGLAGDSASGGDSRANYPNFFAELYNPFAPQGARYTTLARSQIARLYHSTAGLTRNGTILVTGCDRCWKIQTNMTYTPPPAKAEYRNEIFYPPFWYNFNDKPTILSIPEAISYNTQFTVTYTGTVTNVTIVAPSSTTHCFNTNQRVVGLRILKNDAVNKVLTLEGPPNVNIAPAQKYMLFLLNGLTYSMAEWVLLA